MIGLDEAIELLNKKAAKPSGKGKQPVKRASDPWQADGFRAFTAHRKRELRKLPDRPKAAELAAMLAEEWSQLSTKSKATFVEADQKQKQPAAAKGPQAEAASPGKKRPLSGYNIFCKERREELKNNGQSQQMKPTEVMKLLGEDWKNCSEDEKSKYTQQARDSQPAGGKGPEIKAASAAQKKPLSGYNLFCKQRRQELKDSGQSQQMKPTEVMKLLGEKWNTCSEDERSNYTQQAKDLTHSK